MKNRIKIFSFMVSAALIFLSIGPLPATAASYDDIAFGITYQNSLSYATDTNFYYFTADSPGRITIRFETSTATNTLSWRVAIVNESDLKIYLTQDFGSGAASPASASTRIEYTETVQIPSGDYYVLVSVPLSAYYVTSQYKITVGFAEFSQGSGDASFSTLTSPNASARNASAMELNTTMTQNLKSASDTNYFKITVPYHGALVLSFSVESGIDSGDWTILLYDQNEKQLQLGRMGVGGDVINKIRTNKLDRLRLPPGEYYIKVAAYSPSAFSTANYSIYADYTAEKSSEYEKEFNDTLESATNILINAPVTGNLSNAEDRDYFRFTVSDHRELKMMFSSPGSLESNMWTIYLLDAKGGIATYRAGRSGEVANGIRVFESEKLTLEPGLYYIVIYRFEEAYFNGNYTLLVHSDTAPVPGVQDSEYAYPTQTPDYSYNINTELTGQIKGAGDQNTFDFGLSYSGSVSLDFVSPAAVVKQSWIANIFDKNNRLLTSVKCGESGALGALGDTKVTTSDKIRVPAGSYYVQVLPINAYDYSTASYKIKINYSPEAKEATFSSVESFETEYNNSPYTANALSFGSPMTANLSDHEDLDYFKFVLAENSRVNISFSTFLTEKQNDWVVELYNSNFTTTEPLYKQYFGAEGEVVGQNEYKTQASNNIRLAPGTYYIKVGAYNVINYSNADYQITLNLAEERAGYFLYETEFNNSFETANLLPINTDMTGDVLGADDMDYFKVCIEEPQTIQIKFSLGSAVNANLWGIKLYDEAQKELKSYKVGEGGIFLPDGTKYFKTEKIDLLPGDYFVSVGPYAKPEFSNEEYTIKILDEAGQKVDLYVYAADRPSDWALYEVGFAYGHDLVPQGYMKDFTTAITREEFCILAVKFLEVAEKKPVSQILSEREKSLEYGVFDDTSDTIILSAYSLGIIAGRGNRIFDPSGAITREEAAAMLMRVGILADINMNTEPLSFYDEASFSSWAASAIGYVSGCIDQRGNRIMNGYADGGFYPKDTYSKEQAFMTIFRLYANKTGK